MKHQNQMIEATVYYVSSGWLTAGLLIVNILAIATLAFAGMRLMAAAFGAREAVQYAFVVWLRGLLAMPPAMFLAGYIFGPTLA